MDDNPAPVNDSSYLLGLSDKDFRHAVSSAHDKMFGRVGGPYNVDSMAYFATAIECYQYARDNMEGKPRFSNRNDLLLHCTNAINIDGLIMEFGVFSGNTINLIADKLSGDKVYGFDSFQGLPERWTPGAGAGHFAREGLPQVRDNVELVVGWFDRTLPAFLESRTQNVSFLHIDCDLYSSTQIVLTQLRRRIVPGTVIVFDEYFNYPDWKRHEFLAFQEFINSQQLRYEYIGLVPCYEQVAVRIV
jgi:hypothetical protein